MKTSGQNSEAQLIEDTEETKFNDNFNRFLSDGTNFYSSRQLTFSQHAVNSQARVEGGGEPNAGEAEAS